MQYLQRVEQRRHDPVQLLLGRQAAGTLQPVLEAFALLEAHHHIGGRIGFEHAVDANDIWMIKARKCASFAKEIGAAPIERTPMTVRLGRTLIVPARSPKSNG